MIYIQYDGGDNDGYYDADNDNDAGSDDDDDDDDVGNNNVGNNNDDDEHFDYVLHNLFLSSLSFFFRFLVFYYKCGIK
jgi:hypothetical protein